VLETLLWILVIWTSCSLLVAGVWWRAVVAFGAPGQRQGSGGHREARPAPRGTDGPRRSCSGRVHGSSRPLHDGRFPRQT
jgi:hypothetical protein